MEVDGEITTSTLTNLVMIRKLMSHLPIGRGGELRDRHFKHENCSQFLTSPNLG
jgi:hypothetical protein